MTTVTLIVDEADPGPSADIQLRWTRRTTDPVRGSFENLFDIGALAPATLDLLTVAAGVYAADKAVLRKPTSDSWTRNISLNVPLTRQDRFDTTNVQQLLTHLTGDRWEVNGFQRTLQPKNANTIAKRTTPTPVALFSGGMDSFAHYSETAATVQELVAHKDSSPLGKRQQALALLLNPNASLRQFTLAIQRVEPLSYELETSTRSRSFLFIAAAVAYAHSRDTPKVLVPENGFISLNPPLLPARRGSLSTRTTHPWTFQLLNQLLEEMGLAVLVENPYFSCTKGDITHRALANTKPPVLFLTVSCSRARARRSDLIHFGNCGYCYPCLVRRAGIHSCALQDGTPYRRDPFRDVTILAGPAGDDMKAVASRIRRPFTIHDLLATARLPSGTDYASCEDVMERSRRELVALFEDNLSTAMRRALGW